MMRKNRITGSLCLVLSACLVLATTAFAQEESSEEYTEPAETVEETVTEESEVAETEPADPLPEDDFQNSADGLGEIIYAFLDASGNATRCVNSEQEELEDANLPVEMKVSYLLDGEEIAPEDLAGKSGRVTIRFDYEPAYFITKEIDGEETQVAAPFAAATGLVLDNEHFSSIETVNARSFNDGRRTIIVGLALPGLADDLGLDDDIIEVPDYIEVSADTDSFALDMSLGLVTDEIFRNPKLQEFLLSESPEDPKEALKEAADLLSEDYEKLSEAITGLLTDADELNSGIDQLTTGAATLSDGLSTLTENNEALTDGAKTVFTSLLDAANAQLGESGLEYDELTLENYEESLTALLDSLDPEKTENPGSQYEALRAKVTKAVDEAVKEKVYDAVRDQVKTKVISAATGMWRVAYDAAAAIGKVSEEDQAKVEAAVDEQMATDEVQAILSEQLTAQLEGEEVASIIEEKTKEQIDKISSLKDSLISYNTFYTGLIAYTDGVAQAAEGASALSAGLDTLQTTLSGAVDTAEQKVTGLVERVRAMKAAGDEYHETCQGGDARMTFIYRTEGVTR